MNANDIEKTKVILHQSEARRLMSWLRCNPVVGREDERRSLEQIISIALQLSGASCVGYESSL